MFMANLPPPFCRRGWGFSRVRGAWKWPSAATLIKPKGADWFRSFDAMDQAAVASVPCGCPVSGSIASISLRNDEPGNGGANR